MVNERISQSDDGLPEISNPSIHLSETEMIHVKEESFNLFHKEDEISPVIFQNNNMKKELEEYSPDLGLLDTEDNESDEETIATFITAAGQQLALYAVEDSEEVFAVAVYDESGEPPSDFQFLMKEDVEKLIGEGAVRTVKKTPQFKKQIYSMENIESIVPEPIEPPEPLEETPQIHQKEIIQEFNSTHVKEENSFADEDVNLTEPLTKPVLNFEENVVNPELYEHWPSENVFLVVQESPSIERPEETVRKAPVKEEINTKVMEESVQYILSDEPPPDPSDLTLADIEKILERDIPRSKAASREVKAEMYSRVDMDSSYETLEDINVEDHESFPQEVIFNTQTSPEVLRIKRPRKQQLTAVNRADSEIIIQPAIMAEVDDDNVYGNGWRVQPKKRGRRKKNETMKKTKYMKTRRKNKPRKKKKNRIEVIDIDVEDVNREIITLEDGKEKGSSDKENDVIMVGDSDDDDEDKDDDVEPDDSDDSDYDDGAERRRSRRLEVFKCQGCRREFRGKRALETHARVCSKGKPSERMSERTRTETRRSGPMRAARLKSTSDGSREKKEYKCKSCHERFEVVVALARHVRLMHTLKKKMTGGFKEKKESLEDTSRATRSLRKREKEKKIEGRRKERFEKVRKVRSWRNAGTRKMNCRDCGRWFSSLAMMLAHSLQHATKKIVSEKSKVQRCRRCKKVFRSRFLYIRHLRSHSSPSTLRKRQSSVIRQSVVKTTMNKRGRPQKS
ncbi:glutamic acid-rich protein-like [Fopius arisanus]|uniref:Glutamic acid-rich protein-like n=1 Tax=Fopius arisanus TaxID=64838 RepID=A0A9R1T688_9HYME|nr:PREDICTED: glutamic acid-rich protein-like [Fopius arisanus]XP_011303614.1 PREDICTED: glutamic acid-rich protein-like [Fopius arisanus]